MVHIRKKENCQAFSSPHGETAYELIGHVAGGSKNYSLAHIELLPGKSSLKHLHPIAEESYYILKGKARMVIGDKEISLSEGDAICIPPQTSHQIFNDSDRTISFLAICVPAWTPECSIFI